MAERDRPGNDQQDRTYHREGAGVATAAPEANGGACCHGAGHQRLHLGCGVRCAKSFGSAPGEDLTPRRDHQRIQLAGTEFGEQRRVGDGDGWGGSEDLECGGKYQQGHQAGADAQCHAVLQAVHGRGTPVSSPALKKAPWASSMASAEVAPGIMDS